jgi:acetyl-CoA carboxylase biotin carboxylase subunit
MFERILIANRGEIAVRIIRAARELGIETVAVYSQGDKDSLHVKLADRAICVGKTASSESYLNIPAIISAAEIADVEAIHPGFGFLAENAHFAEICESCQIKFIGPQPESIRLMGDKALARKTMMDIKVPVIPGSKDVVRTPEEALKLAKKYGYPVIIKAKAGGGGKGMRIAHNDGKLISAFMTAQTEAEKAFGNKEVYLEKYLQGPRHIEVQILADSKGNVIQLGERDCSLQRRHQKLLEESPSPALDAKVRKQLGEWAIRAAKSVKYENAGTVEFLMDANSNLFFIEMNTRIQVEHPVTEMVTGIDIVKEQIRIAAGEPLSVSQDEVRFEGAAIECRINAEDPDNNFMPSPGKVELVIFPGGPNVRVDSHIYPGYVIPSSYDSMIAKIIVKGKDRADAIRIMNRALRETTVSPVKTTIPLQLKLINDPNFVNGNFNTHYVTNLLESRVHEDEA